MANTLLDIEAALEYLHRPDSIEKFRINTDQIILGGWSYGGGMALSNAAIDPSIERIFSVAGTDHGAFIRDYSRNPEIATMIDEMFESLKYPQGPVKFADKFAINELLEDSASYDLRIIAKDLANREILLIGGWDDTNVTIEQNILPLYRALVEKGAMQVKIMAFQDDHSFTASRDKVARAIVEWISVKLSKQRRMSF